MSVRGVVACIPEKEVRNERDYPWFDAAEIRKITSMAGIKSRRVTADNVCTSDLCVAAGQALLKRLAWDPATVDGLILVTQTPDYVMPSTSCIIQQRLGIPNTCAAFDVGLGCSAYVYGLWLANSLIASGGCRRVLLMTGETPSKFVDPKDRTTALLFGDAGSATALEASDKTKGPTRAYYVMRSDGTGANHLIIRGGMFRDRFPEEISEYCVHMDGVQIFDFTRTYVPALIDDVYALSSTTAKDYEYFIFHQANQYLIKFIASKAGVDMAHVPLSIGDFGNTGAASVPLTLALAGTPKTLGSDYNVMLLGFGVGLSWGGVSLRLPHGCVLDHIVYAP